MATYKLIQDIEAEDHILGPLTLRQFIFAIVAAFFGYLCFIVATKGAAFLLVLFGPPAIFCGFFAFPFGRDQPTEIWFLAKLRFWFLPRTRVWNQSGVKELVTITAPKKVERVLTDGLSQTEVKSRLQALANTIDSRGWAIKNIAAYPQPAMAMVGGADSERLIDLNSMSMPVPTDDTRADDIMDEQNNPVAQQMESLITQSNQAHRQKLVDELSAPAAVPAAPQNNQWFMSQGAAVAPAAASALPPEPPQVAAPPALAPVTAAPDDPALAEKLKRQAGSKDVTYSRMHTLHPMDEQPAAPTPASPKTTTINDDSAVIALAGNDDLSVAALAHEAKRAKGEEDGEVVINLH